MTEKMTRSQKIGRWKRIVDDKAKKLEIQNDVMNDKRADPQRVKRAFPNSREETRARE